MNWFFKVGCNIAAGHMRRNDIKVKRKLPPILGVNKYLSISYVDKKYDNYRKFNLYRPSHEQDECPLIIDIHGGAWIYGDKNLNEEYAMYLASQGYNTLTFSYRLLTMTNLKGMIQDVFAFMHYVYDNQKKLGISFNDVMISGDSAGAHLALLALAVNSSEELLKIYEVQKLPFDVDFLTLEHPVPFINELLPSDKKSNKLVNKMFYNSFFKPLNENKDIAETANLNDFIKYAKYPPILVVTCTGDDLKHFYDDTIKCFSEYNVKYESRVYGGLFHVFQVLNYSLPESKEFNDYSLERFNEIINMKRGQNA